MLSGGAGHMYGNHYTWTFAPGWQQNLDTPGALQLKYMKQFFGARQWWNLVPDQNHIVVTAGYGTFATSGSLNSNDYVTAARVPDGSLVIAYCPTSTTITVDMTQLNGLVTARWFDPSTATFQAIEGSPFANAGTQSFPTPGTNGGGAGDWVLVLETAD